MEAEQEKRTGLIQGGATSVILLMFSQIGIGNGMAELIVTINTLLQFLIVPTNLFCTQCVILLLANKEKKLNAETLKKSVA